MRCTLFRLAVLGLGLAAVYGAQATDRHGEELGPYNLRILEGGVGVSRPLAANWSALPARAAWSVHGWVRLSRRVPATVILAAIGEPDRDAWWGVALREGRLILVLDPALASGAGSTAASEPLEAQRRYALAATYDGQTGRLYLDGREVAALKLATTRVSPQLHLAPPGAATAQGPGAHFGGDLVEFSIAPGIASGVDISTWAAKPPDESLINSNPVGVGWPLQEKAWRGLLQPQDPWTLPKSKAAQVAPEAQPMSIAPALESSGANQWQLHRWKLREAGGVAAAGAQLSSEHFDDADWYAALVPGTVLTSLIARGVYPDPDYGLNNLAIPETLARQDYWYRTVFTAPTQGQEYFTLTFKGINYAADVWLNGERLGTIRGAFVRGVFDVTGKLKRGSNALAVRVSPPPHPGIPHEQSVLAGPGENGGAMALDGPTFIATEGWDWIPGIRDRNTGIWQEVELLKSGPLRLLDPHIVTHLPLPAIDRAEVAITVPVQNQTARPIKATVRARFDTVTVEKSLLLQPGITEVRLEPKDYPQLTVTAPRLWWPNGYGEPNLYTLHLEVLDNKQPSDSQQVKFGMRELTYELSLFDHSGRLRRVEIDPTGSAAGQSLVDVRHEAIKRTPLGWAESLTAAGETSPAVHDIDSVSLTPFLTLRVNGVAIAARGGSWGMDDSRKRIARARLEPYFKMQRAAHLNIIRNWLGQNTEDVFYDLADENGLLVLNDFWISTQDFQLEPQDPQLFLANARDVMLRYRNHPSIAVWFGRNEGMPPPLLNEGLDNLAATLDGTRYYTGSSNSVNLQGSGPYNYRPPAQYFTELAQGFSVEVGTPSLSTLESLRASIPAADLWPIGDTLAYHDWHFGGNGDTASFMSALQNQYGPAGGIEDFERKAQMMNYVTYRAIFEGFQAHLWSRNSGRLLWMSHPSWPSNAWQLYSSDYDAGAAYYAVKKACEPLHAQLELPDYRLAVVNTTRQPELGLRLHTRVTSLDNRVLRDQFAAVDAPANATSAVGMLDLQPLLDQEGLVLVSLKLTNTAGKLLSDNVYWQAKDDGHMRALSALPARRLTVSARVRRTEQESVVTVNLSNTDSSAALGAKVMLTDEQGQRVLPSYYSDNYLTLLPGESKSVDVHCPHDGARCARVALRGFNVEPQEVQIPQP